MGFAVTTTTNLVADGSLYVGHKMFGKLPDAYTQHRTYLRLFPGSVRSSLASAESLLISLDRVFSKQVLQPCVEWSTRRDSHYLVGR
jgi:hypothetical protein